MSSVPINNRLHSFDLLRLTLVLIALLNHFMITHGGRPEKDETESSVVVQEVIQEDQIIEDEGKFDKRTLNAHVKTPDLKKEAFDYVLAVTRSAMPVLLIIFGFMIEYVYAKRWEKQGSRIIFERMMNRAAICYLAFASIVFLVFVQGDFPLTSFLGSMVFLNEGHSHANLFMYYALLIPMTFMLMVIRFKFGWGWKLFLVVLFITIAESIKLSYIGLSGVSAYGSQLFLGLGDKMGPSMIHSLILILFGELVAFFHLTKKVSFPFIALLLLSVFSFVAIAEEIYTIGFEKFVVNTADYYHYRAKNSYIYFAYGIVTFIIFWGLSWGVMLKLGNFMKEKISYYGGNTFIIFFYGNVVVLLLPELIDNKIVKLVFAIIALIISLAAVNVFDWVNNKFKFVGNINRLISLLVSKSISILYIGNPGFSKNKTYLTTGEFPDFKNGLDKNNVSERLSKDNSNIPTP